MQESSMEQLWRSSHIAGGNATYVEDLYEVYLKNPNGVPEQWREYFHKLPRVRSEVVQLLDVPHSVIRDRFAQISVPFTSSRHAGDGPSATTSRRSGTCSKARSASEAGSAHRAR